jgi:hypothetical protein
MSSPQASGATSPSGGGQLEDAVSAFSDAVFEATQGLLKAQHELTRTVLGGRGGQRDEHEQKPVPVTDETGGQEHGDDRDEATTDLSTTAADEAGEVDEGDDEAGEVDEGDDEAGEVEGQVPGEAAPGDELVEDDEGAVNDEEEPDEAEDEYAEEGEESAADDLDEADRDEADQDEADQDKAARPVPARSGRRR